MPISVPFYDEIKIVDGKAVGGDPGCGCCGGDTTLTVQQLDAYIVRLRDTLERAKEVRTQVFGPDYSN